MKTPCPLIEFTTLLVLACLGGGVALWVHQEPLTEYFKDEPTMVMDGIRCRSMSEREFRLNYLRYGSAPPPPPSPPPNAWDWWDKWL